MSVDEMSGCTPQHSSTTALSLCAVPIESPMSHLTRSCLTNVRCEVSTQKMQRAGFPATFTVVKLERPSIHDNTSKQRASLW